MRITQDAPAGGGGSDTSFFSIWAEENSTLGASNTYEWAFGNGSNTQSNEGILMYVPTGYTLTCVAIGAQVDGGTPSATIELVLNGSPQGSSAQVVLTTENERMTELGTPLAIANADRINFRTVSASGTATSSRVVAWFKMVKA